MKIAISPSLRKMVLASFLPVSLAACGSGTTFDQQSAETPLGSGSLQTLELSNAPILGGALPRPVDELGAVAPITTDSDSGLVPESSINTAGLSLLDFPSDDIAEGAFVHETWDSMIPSGSGSWVSHSALEENISVQTIGGNRYINARMDPIDGAGSNRPELIISVPDSTHGRMVYGLNFEPDFDFGSVLNKREIKVGGGFVSDKIMSGSSTDVDGFSSRLVVKGDDTIGEDEAWLSMHILSANRVNKYGDFLYLTNADGSRHIVQRDVDYRVGIEMKMNSVASAADGFIKIWLELDGVVWQALNEQNIQWWGTGTPLIERIFWQMYHGGTGEDYQPGRSNNIRFDMLGWADGPFDWTVPVLEAAEPEPEPAPEPEPEPEPAAEPEPEPAPAPEPEPESSPTDNNQPIADEPVFSGQLESGSTLSSAQCLALSGPAQDFGQVDRSDWEDWIDEDFWYITTPENMSMAYDGDKPYMRQKLEPRSNGSTRVQAGNYLESARTYRITQSIFFEPDFDWGGSNEGGKVGFGFGGGTTPSGGQIQTDGFTLRLMWRGNRDGTARLTAYSYAADRGQNHIYGEDFDFEGFEIPIGEWFDVTLEVKSNSNTSTSDGSLRAWVDGNQVLQRDNIGWQTSGNQPAIQKLIFTTFYGGGDSTWSPSGTTYIRYADACWATVLNPSGELLDDFESGPVTTPPTFLLDQAVLTNRGALGKAFIDIELLLPTGSVVLNERLSLTLDTINAALAGTEWLDNNSISAGTPVVPQLTNATERLAEISADESLADYFRNEANANIWVILDLTQNLVRNAITIEAFNVAYGSNKARMLDQADATIVLSETNGLPSYEVIRLINEAWNDVTSAANL